MIKLAIKARKLASCAHITSSHVSTTMFSQNQRVLEKTLTNLWKGILQKLPFKKVSIRVGEWLKMKGDLRISDSQCLAFDWILGLGGGTAIKDKWVNSNMDRTLYNSTISMFNFLTAHCTGDTHTGSVLMNHMLRYSGYEVSQSLQLTQLIQQKKRKRKKIRERSVTKC